MLAQSASAFDFSKVPPIVWAVLAGLIPVLIVVPILVVLARRKKPTKEFAAPPPLKGAAAPYEDPFHPGAVQERRGSLRRGGNPVPVFISDAEARADPYRGWVVDRSMGGLCVSVEEAVAPGTILSVRAASSPPTVPWVQVEVRNCRAADDRWELGCQFTRTPPWGTLLLFG